MLKYLAFVSAVVYVCRGQDGSVPSGSALDKLEKESFNNLDYNNDTFVEKDEFESFVIIADNDNDGCMTLSEYKVFSAGTPDVATKIFQHFDPDNSNCITVDKVAAQFGIMDADQNAKVSLDEFKAYYKKITQVACVIAISNEYAGRVGCSNYTRHESDLTSISATYA